MTTMTTTQPSARTTAGTLTEKTVTVIAYAANDAFKSPRAMADELNGERDYYERDRRTSRTVELVHTDEDGNQRTTGVFTECIRDALVDADIDSEELTVEETVETTRPYAHSPTDEVKGVRDSIVSGLPDTLSGGVEQGLWGYKWQDEEHRTRVEVGYGTLDYRRPLAHRSERNGRKKYDDTRKHLSMQFTVELGPETEDMIETWSEELVAEFVKALWDVEWVETVRVADCKETVEREGDCFDL